MGCVGCPLSNSYRYPHDLRDCTSFSWGPVRILLWIRNISFPKCDTSIVEHLTATYQSTVLVPYLGCQHQIKLVVVVAIRQSSSLFLHAYKTHAEVLWQSTWLIGVGILVNRAPCWYRTAILYSLVGLENQKKEETREIYQFFCSQTAPSSAPDIAVVLRGSTSSRLTQYVRHNRAGSNIRGLSRTYIRAQKQNYTTSVSRLKKFAGPIVF